MTMENIQHVVNFISEKKKRTHFIKCLTYPAPVALANPSLSDYIVLIARIKDLKKLSRLKNWDTNTKTDWQNIFWCMTFFLSLLYISLIFVKAWHRTVLCARNILYMFIFKFPSIWLNSHLAITKFTTIAN